MDDGAGWCHSISVSKGWLPKPSKQEEHGVEKNEFMQFV